MEDAQEQGDIRDYSELKPYQFKKGQSGNPGGRPKGTISLKEYAKRYLQQMSDDEKLTFMEGLNKDTIWKMSEGNPSNHTDVTTGGEPLGVVILPERNDTKDTLDTTKKTEDSSS